MKTKTTMYLRLWVLMFFICLSVAQAQTHVDSLYKRYPVVKSGMCPACMLWVNPYFSVITNTKLRQSVVSCAYLTPDRDKLIDKVKANRTKYGVWHCIPGYQKEDKFYNDINSTIKVTTDKYAKGHYIGYMLCAWTIDGAILSCTYDFNEGIEIQGQNEGTELQVEELTRALVGNKAFCGKVHYTGPYYPIVQYWKGSNGSIKVFNVDGISKNYSAVYWNLLKYGNQLHAYWFPNDNTATAKVGYQHYEIQYPELVKRLGFDPVATLQN
jgi:hypothetical protein